MNENLIPKWQKELRAFLGIKSGIILEGNVYDEFPQFEDDGSGGFEFSDTDTLDQTLLGLVDGEKTETVFFDPVVGFYSRGADADGQRKILAPLLDDYHTTETLTDHGMTVCMMPSGKQKNDGGSPETSKYIWMSEIIRRTMLDFRSDAGKENIVFVINFASRLDASNLRAAEANTMFLNLMAATTAGQRFQLFCNSLIMVVDKYNDIPAWVYLNNPNMRTVSIGFPDRYTRRLYLENLFGPLQPYSVLSRDDNVAGKQFVAETEGLRMQELRQILQLAVRRGIKPDDINLAFRLYKYGVLENPWENLEDDILIHIENKLSERVKGQDEALEKVKSVITRAVKGMSGLQHSGSSHKPKGIMFFAGPTGVGKTETAKALAESIFGDENACIRFDMSEYRLEQSDQKLFGAPPGYIGYEGGGQLTNAVKNHPFSVILFDEIEKASPTILDKFLQILEDGRMTDNQGNTVYFGESIIIFTSNIGLTKESDDPNNIFRANPHRVPTITIEDPMKEDTPEFRAMVTETLTAGVKAYFNDNGRPELLNRLGDENIIVFQFIGKRNAEIICDYKLKKICQTIKNEKNITVITDGVTDMLHEKAVMERANGGRGVGNMLEKEFLNPLAGYICTLGAMPTALKCTADGGKVRFEAI
ncbi:MAG: AAA family ATPase [Clostridiales bacterium]|nr:AAA family ATPase [Clostridiales bacterium]